MRDIVPPDSLCHATLPPTGNGDLPSTELLLIAVFGQRQLSPSLPCLSVQVYSIVLLEKVAINDVLLYFRSPDAMPLPTLKLLIGLYNINGGTSQISLLLTCEKSIFCPNFCRGRRPPNFTAFYKPD